MRVAAAGAIVLAMVLGGCAASDGSTIELAPADAAEHYRAVLCRVIASDGAVESALAGDDGEAVFEAARERAVLLSRRGVLISEAHIWPQAVREFDEELGRELEWVLRVADADSVEAGRALQAPDPRQRAAVDLSARQSLGLPTDDAALCAPAV